MADGTLTQKRLKEVLHYDPSTGRFTWIKPTNKRISIGSIAGRLDKSNGYINIGIDGRKYGAHRLAFLYMTGQLPQDQVDHISHNRADNRWRFIRQATNLKNGKNIKLRSDNLSGHLGVNWNKAVKKWVVRISVDRKSIYLGVFCSFFDAVCARKSAELKHGYHENHGLSM